MKYKRNNRIEKIREENTTNRQLWFGKSDGSELRINICGQNRHLR